MRMTVWSALDLIMKRTLGHLDKCFSRLIILFLIGKIVELVIFLFFVRVISFLGD
jgi:hypothetical protein